MRKIMDILKHITQENQIIDDKEPELKPKIKFSTVYKYWVCDYITEQLKDIVTPGNKYRMYRGEFPEEFYFIDDQGVQNSSPLMFYMGHFVKEDNDGLQEIVVPSEARVAFANGILMRINEMLKMWEVIENDLTHDEDDSNDGWLKKDIEKALQEIREGKY